MAAHCGCVVGYPSLTVVATEALSVAQVVISGWLVIRPEPYLAAFLMIWLICDKALCGMTCGSLEQPLFRFMGLALNPDRQE